MSTKKENAVVVGVGVAACAVCCAGPILGFLAAIGLGMAAGFALFGTATLAIGALASVVVLRRRRRRPTSCADTPGPVTVPMRIGGHTDDISRPLPTSDRAIAPLRRPRRHHRLTD